MKFYALLLAPLALACGPGTGPITTTPTMQFTFSYPLSWTYATPTGAGQSLSQQSAQNRINSDIEYAVIMAVESYGYSATGVSVQNAVAPLSIPINVGATCTAIGNGVVGGTTVTNKCADATSAITAAPAFNTTSSITVTSPVALYQSQWQNIAINIMQSLTSNAGVLFYGIIQVV